MTESMKRWNRTSRARAIPLVSSEGIPITSKNGARGNFEIKLFYPKIGGHVLTLEFGSLHETP